jgi:hypothetical protein
MTNWNPHRDRLSPGRGIVPRVKQTVVTQTGKWSILNFDVVSGEINHLSDFRSMDTVNDMSNTRLQLQKSRSGQTRTEHSLLMDLGGKCERWLIIN